MIVPGNPARLRKVVAVIGLTLFATAGCQNESMTITRIQLPLEETGLVEVLPQFRSIAAMTESGERTWFVKIAAPPSRVELVVEPLRQLIATTSFDAAGEPQFILPDGWTTHRNSAERYLTIRVPMESGDPAEIAVTVLGGDQDRLMNVNRWRRQLSLPPLKPGELEKSLERISSPGGEWLLFDNTGKWNPSSMGPMMMGGMEEGSSGSPANEPPIAGQIESAITGVVATPAGFDRDPDGPFVVASFRKKDDSGAVRLSVSELPGELNPWEASVGSWLSESEITGLDEKLLEERTDELVVQGWPARRIELLPESADEGKGVVGLRIEIGMQAVYLKLSGDAAAVRKNAAIVEEVVKRIPLKKFTGNEPESSPSISGEEK